MLTVLNPGELQGNGWHKDGKCYNKYACKHSDHTRYTRKKHVFVRGHYEKDAKSKKLLKLFYKERIGIHANLPEFSKGILGYSSVHIANISTVSNNIQQPLYIVPALRSQHKE